MPIHSRSGYTRRRPRGSPTQYEDVRLYGSDNMTGIA